ncbi:craniofacial development protein 2-like [Biomphalaria glabrata]|uniref:Craniofacial development protein 2-like n=1 Tax=Biomphalaria glabrata TaxID=6526 RepID=A0A9W2ZEJ9_BIOGL|nr:craniofacial development protein 2-like [Biomphalaria glabrata]XP_055873310.1 craniofacial development protein 2-like [Biomphalaria glabrata]XP_055873311.1 craniofacial development protein 2-like [Biomphalaria glabrata]
MTEIFSNDGQNGVFCFATWNVRSIQCTKSFVNVSSVIDKSNADIVCLQETKFGYNKPFEINNYKYVLKHETQKMPYGMGFAIRKSLWLNITVDPNPSERLCSLSLKTAWGNIHIINVYAPSEVKREKEKEEELKREKDEFYRQLKEKFMVLPDSDYVFLLGDFNAQVGRNHSSWSTCIGEFGLRQMNDNGQRLLEFCSCHKLCVTNTYYEGPDENKYTWIHHNPKASNIQIDLCLIRHEHLKTLIETKSIPMDKKDHLMVTCHVNLSSQNEIKPFFYEPLLNFLIDQCQYLDHGTILMEHQLRDFMIRVPSRIFFRAPYQFEKSMRMPKKKFTPRATWIDLH